MFLAASLTATAFAAVFSLQGCTVSSEEDLSEDANPSHGMAISMASCGTALASFDGSTAYSNGNDTGTGYSCAGTGAYGYQYQCVELVQRHFKTHWGLRWYGNAKDLLANAPKASVDVYDNGDSAHPPVPGDMIVWTNGTWGHVALVTAVTSGGIEIIEQNVKGNGSATLPWDGATIGARWGNWIPAGWAHAKANGNGGTGGNGTGGNTGTTTTTTTTTGTGGSTPGGWDCNDSSYNGNQYWTCSNSTIYKCVGGVPQEQDCPNGCQVNALGTDDACKSGSSGVSWSCADSSYNGNQYWTCSNGDIYKCVGGVPQMQDCVNGCKVNALGTDDNCK